MSEVVAHSEQERRVASKIFWRLIAPLTFLLFLSSLDRSNIAIAALRMNEEIGLTPEMYGRGAGFFFFLGYIALQYPHTALLRRFHARRWITATVMVWGCAAAAISLIETADHFYTLRFLLGVAEGGFAPGAAFLAALWMPRRYRASAVAGTMLAVPISQVLGAPLSGWLMSTQIEVAGLSGWRLMTAAEGLMTVLFGLVALTVFVDRLDDARWLTAEEKKLAADEFARDAAERSGTGSLKFLVDPKFWGAAVIWFCLLAGAQGLIFWMAQVVKQVAGGGIFSISLISALPWVGVGAGMIVLSRSSDRTGERHLHLAGAALAGGLCLLLAFLVPPSWGALALLLIGGFGLGGAQGVYWPVLISLLNRDDTSRGITVVNMIGNTAGLVMTPLIGIVRERTGEFGPAIYLVTATVVLAAVTSLALRGKQQPA